MYPENIMILNRYDNFSKEDKRFIDKCLESYRKYNWARPGDSKYEVEFTNIMTYMFGTNKDIIFIIKEILCNNENIKTFLAMSCCDISIRKKEHMIKKLVKENKNLNKKLISLSITRTSYYPKFNGLVREFKQFIELLSKYKNY